MSTETEIQTEVEALKTRFEDTKSLYREVCALLFFRYGITPTANKLYQFVRKGSMSAPADALTKFWDELRSKARIEIDHPDLPGEIKEAAASAIAAVWRQASAAAREELRDARAEAERGMAEARAELATTHEQCRVLQAELDGLHAQLDASTAANDQQRAELESERRAHAASAGRIQELQRTLDDLRTQSQRLQDGFSADLAKAREATEAANARADAAERRALLDIDQERQARSRAEKSLETLRAQSAQTEERFRAEAQSATEASVRQNARIETLERSNQELAGQAERAAATGDALRVQLRMAEDEAARARAEAQTLQRVIDRIAPGSTDTSTPAAATRTRRKASPKDSS